MNKRLRFVVVAGLLTAGVALGMGPTRAGQLCVGTACTPYPAAVGASLQQAVRTSAELLGSTGPACSATGTHVVPVTGSGYTVYVCNPISGPFTEPAAGGFTGTQTGIAADATNDFTGVVERSGDYTYPPNYICSDAGLWIELPTPIDPNAANTFDSPLSLTSWNCEPQ